MRKKLLSMFLALALALAPCSVLSVLAEDAEDGAETLEEEPKVQTIVVRGDGVEDGVENVKYGEAYKAAGLTLSAQPVDGAYTLTIDKKALEAVAADTTGNTYQILENAGNPGKLWFGMEYRAPADVEGIEKASVQFDGSGDFAEIAFNLSGQNQKGFYNYIKVYDGTVGPVQGETAVIQWLSADGTTLATTRAEIKVDVKTEDEETPPPGQYKVTFNSNGGSAVTSVTVASGGTVTQPAAPSKEGCTFAGWYEDAALEKPWNFATAVTKNITLYAKWTEASNPPGDGDGDGDGDDNEGNPPAEFTITFNANGGTVSPDSGTTKDGKLASLPTPTRDGYTFDGWFTAASEGTQVTTATEFKEAVTIYAHWTQKPTVTDPDDTQKEYAIRIAPDIRHGAVDVNYQYAVPGTRVTITVTPNTDYIISWVEAEQANGRLLWLTQSGRRYTFTMPASEVTITASFRLQAVYYSNAYVSYYEPESSAQTASATPYFAPVEWRSAAELRDVPTYSWSYPAAQWAYQNGYLDRDEDGNFWLAGPVSHQQMWSIMAKWMGAPVADDRGAASWALQIGAARGNAPSDAMTRQNVVEYLYQCWFLLGGDVSVTGNLADYRDSQLITSASAKNAWLWAVNRGIISGTADGYLHPSDRVSRGEFSAMLMRLCQNTMR